MAHEMKPEQFNELKNRLLAAVTAEMASLASLKNLIAEAVDEQNITKFIKDLAENSRDFAAVAHSIKFHRYYSSLPTPEWFDHFVDQYLQLRRDRNTYLLERGVYSSMALKRGGDVLDICCGDGYSSFHFHSLFARSITAVDIDPDAVQHAMKYNCAKNINYFQTDIRTNFPAGTFDNIIWDAAIEHFTEAEITAILCDVKGALREEGILSGYTIVERGEGKQHQRHEREFASKDDLASFLTPYFANVSVFETVHPNRHNLYFYASDSVLPFDSDWPGMLKIRDSHAR